MNRELPNDRAAEIALLGDMFLENNIAADIIGRLEPGDFYYKPHEIIFSKFMELYKKDISVDIIVFANNIGKEILQSIGGITYLSQIIGSEMTTANYKEYAKIIRKLSIKRKLIRACQNVLCKAYSEDTDVKSIVDFLGSNILSVDTARQNSTLDSAEFMENTVKKIEEGYNNGGRIQGVSTGFDSIDKTTNGFMRGDLMVIAGRPSMGKTALMLNMIDRIDPENKALLFELEMSSQKLGVRMLAERTMINSRDLSMGNVKESDFDVIVKKAGEISLKDNIYVNYDSWLSVGEIKLEAKKIKIHHGLDVIFIDHIGKIRPDNVRAARNDQIGQISQGLKDLAKDLNVCVVVLSQMNRAVEGRMDKHPVMSDLRDSGNLEQDADEILMLYRDDYYAELENRESLSKGIIQIFISKNRDGETGLITLDYNAGCQLIEEQEKAS